MAKKNKYEGSGRPKGVPVSPIRSIITRLRDTLPESYEIIRAATSFEREKKNLQKLRKRNKLDTTYVEEELLYKLESGLITQDQYDAAMRPKELQKAAYYEQLEEIKVDPDALKQAKWNIERNIDAVIKAGTDEKNRHALKQEVKKALGESAPVEVDDEEEELYSGTSVIGRLRIVGSSN